MHYPADNLYFIFSGLNDYTTTSWLIIWLWLQLWWRNQVQGFKVNTWLQGELSQARRSRTLNQHGCLPTFWCSCASHISQYLPFLPNLLGRRQHRWLMVPRRILKPFFSARVTIHKKEPSITLSVQLLTFPVTADPAMTITGKSYHDFSPTAPTLGW